MSGLLQRNWHFINLLLTTELKQQKILIDNLTGSQCDLLTEIFYNLSHVVELNPEQAKYMRKRAKALVKLSRVNLSRKSRNAIIRKSRRQVLGLLNEVKGDILSINTPAAPQEV